MSPNKDRAGVCTMSAAQHTLGPWFVVRRMVMHEGKRRGMVFVQRGYGSRAEFMRGPVQIGASGWWTIAEARAAIAKVTGQEGGDA